MIKILFGYIHIYRNLYVLKHTSTMKDQLNFTPIAKKKLISTPIQSTYMDWHGVHPNKPWDKKSPREKLTLGLEHHGHGRIKGGLPRLEPPVSLISLLNYGYLTLNYY